MKETIIWHGIDMSDVNVQQALLKSGRSCYDLVIDECELGGLDGLRKSSILQFFKVNGARVRSLVFKNCFVVKSFVEPIILSCECLQSLTLSFCFTYGRPSFSSQLDYFTLEPNTITHPTVTYLELTLPEHQPSKYFHRMLSVFPNVKQLKIEMDDLIHYNFLRNIENFNSKTAQEFAAILDDIMKCGCNLKSLQLNVPLIQLSAKESQFREALSNLENLSIDFHGDAALCESEKFYSGFSNLASLELLDSKGFQLQRVLENTQLNYLKITSSESIVLNEESFKALVSSKLKIVHFETDDIEGLPSSTDLNFPLEANTTVTDLYLIFTSCSLESPVELFPMYFRGLVHLSIQSPTDEILQSIFQYQQNLRSLELVSYCGECSKEGFCGSTDGSLDYSIYNLQKLEHLSIDSVSANTVASDEFKNVFSLPSLEYLRIDCTDTVSCDNRGVRRCAKVPPYLYEKSTRLRAIRIKDDATLTRETVLSVFTNLKYLNYLRFDMDNYSYEGAYAVTFVNSKEFSINTEDHQNAYILGNSYYDEKLDRMVIFNDCLKKTLSSPKISSHRIDWIET